MANKRKILEAARKHAQKGAKDRALKEYEKLLRLDPKDARLRIEIGDAYRRWGQVEDAITIYSKVAEQYMADGFDARAVAVFKQIQNLDPEHWASFEPLGELYQRMGLTAEAINTLQTAADGHHRAGDKREALALLRKMATIDPSNTASRHKVADLLHQEGMNDEAIAEYQAVAGELSRQGEEEQAGQALERILEIDANHAATLVQLVQNLLARGMHDQAEPFAKRCLDQAPEEADHYERLAQVYRAQQREGELEDVYRRMAEVYRQRGDDDRARDIIQRFVSPDALEAGAESQPELELDADDVIDGDVSEFLADDDMGQETLLEEEFILAEDSSPEGASVRPPVAEVTVLAPGAGAGLDAGPDLEEIADLDELVDDDSQPSLDPALDLGEEPPPESLPEGDPDQLLAEANVYLRYGKRAQAIANLQGILATDPGHRGALEKLGEAHAEGGESELAVAHWMKAAERAKEDGAHGAVEVLRDRIGALDEVAAGSLAPAVGESAPEIDPESSALDLDVAVTEAASEAPEDDDLDLGDLEIDIDDSELEDSEFDDSALEDSDLEDSGLEDVQLDDDALGEALALDDAAGSVLGEEAAVTLGDDLEAPVSGPEASASLSVQIGEDLEEADFYIQQGLHDEAEAIFKRILEAAPNHPQALVRLGEIAAARGEDAGSASGGLDVELPEPEELLDVPDVEREPAAMPGDALEDVSVDLNEWTDGEGDELDLDSIDPDSIVGVAGDVDPNAETDIDFDLSAEPEEESTDEANQDALAESPSIGDDVHHDHGPGEGALSEAAAASEDEVFFALDDESDEEREADAEEGDVAIGVEAESVADVAVALDADAPDEDAVIGLDDDATDDATDEEVDAGFEDVLVDDDSVVGIDDPTSDEVSFDLDDEADADDALAASPPPAGEPAGAEAGFDLAAELSDAFDGEPNGASASGNLSGTDDGFAAVFQDFKKGVQDTLSDGDHQAHFDLGIAYREMGLLDDAMGEFRTAMGDDSRRLDCLQMLGLCSLERDCTEDAVAHFQEALALDGLDDDQLLALRFELGRAYESHGDVPQAREAWEAVAASDPTFCEVGERLAALEDLEKDEDAPEVGADTSPTESFESFDDVIGETEPDHPAEAASGDAHVDFDDLVAEANADDDDDMDVDVDVDDLSDDDDEETADAQSHEDFQDLVSELSADPEESQAEVEPIEDPSQGDSEADTPIAAESAETEEHTDSPDADEASAEVAASEPEPAVEPEPEPERKKPRRRKKKISFV